MLKKRIIPTLLIKGASLVKGVAFDSWRVVGTALPAITVFNSREVDELILLDINATNEGLEPDYFSIQEFASNCFVPLTIGGGVNRLDHIEKLLRAGADKIVVNTVCYNNPKFVSEAAKTFGSQCIVASVDYAAGKSNDLYCFSNSGTNSIKRDPILWARELESLGAGEIMLTRIEYDGLMKGYDLDTLRKVCEQVNLPVIVSGGAGTYAHLVEALKEGASAVAAASIFQFTDSTPLEAKKLIEAAGLPVRKTLIS